MKKCITYASLFVLSFIGSFGLLSDSVSAASPFDDFDIVNENLLYDNEGYCDLESHATNWYQGLTNNRFNRPYFDDMMDDYDDWLANDGGVTIYSSGTYIHVIFTENKNDYGFGFQDLGSQRRLTLSNGNYNSSTPVWHAQLFRDPSWQNCTLYLQSATKYTNGFAQILFSDNLSTYPDTTGVFISDAHRNYPVGYEGQLIPESWAPPPPEPIAHKPNITWDVIDKQATVYSDSLKNTAVLQDYQIYWFISNTTFDMTQPSEAFAISGCTPPDFNNNFTVPVHFDYGIQAYYADEDCNILDVDDNGEPLIDNMVVITIDGSTFNGSTDDHVAIIGNIPENLILQSIRKFKPTDGGLTTLVFAPIEAVASLPDIVGTCTPITLPLLGQNVSLTCIRPTIQNSPMGGVYTVISVIVTGMVTWFVAWRTFGTIKNIQDPQDDKVEVLKL